MKGRSLAQQASREHAARPRARALGSRARRWQACETCHAARLLLAVLLVALGQLTLAGRAHAGGFDMARPGSEHGHAAGSTPFALHYNPAALTLTRRLHLAVDLSVGLHHARYRRTETSEPEPADAPGATTGSTRAFDVIAGPSLAGSMRFGQFTVGVGLYAPYAGYQRWHGNDRFVGNTSYPGAQDGPARFHLIEGYFNSFNLSTGAAYRLPVAGLSLGATVSANYTQLAFTRALTASFNDDASIEQRVHVDASGVTGNFALGVLWEAIAQKLWLGLSYQAPPGLDGMVLRGSMRSSLGGEITRTSVDVHQSLPDALRWAVRARPRSSYELRLFGDYTRWSKLDRQCLPKRGEPCDIETGGGESEGTGVLANIVRRWQDTASVRAGASYYPSARGELFAGLGYDGNAIPDATLDPSLLDGHDLSATLGGRLRMGQHAALLLSYAHVHTLTRDTTGKSRHDSYENPSRLPSAGGEYQQWLGLLTCMLELYLD